MKTTEEKHDRDCATRTGGMCDCLALIPGAYPENETDEVTHHISPLLREAGEILIARGHDAGEVRAKLAGGDFDEDRFWEDFAGPMVDGLARLLGLEPMPKEAA